ncbi:conserved hypothetical protein [Lodderomyces elongisporus NRRL YB-4239]|uniref:Uncharacterized protein n=1 Tax=Lodderomyces elongisporus (strain ATCC 11503 / CBS 2605 / JCM 1781 / NBRC 1676 / NRRL YB-4239) TaxID=379508 RepID=A5DYP2_LODEL|nr:conserved hypothetical protein [Lodderomyces elongisporus NRRL YB-4239]
MISRTSLRSVQRIVRSGVLQNATAKQVNCAQLGSIRTIRNYSDKTILDLPTGKTITLADPNHPEYGDYKNPEPVLAQSRDPYAKYDDQQNRRNLNDPVNMDADLYDMWSPDYYDFVSDSEALKQNAIFFGLLFGVAGLVAYFQLNPEKPAMIRSFPYNGMAEALGSTSDENAPFYQAKVDHTAEKECGVLPQDVEQKSNTESYLKANDAFINTLK